MPGYSTDAWIVFALIAAAGVIAVLQIAATQFREQRRVHDLKVQVRALHASYQKRVSELYSEQADGEVEEVEEVEEAVEQGSTEPTKPDRSAPELPADGHENAVAGQIATANEHEPPAAQPADPAPTTHPEAEQAA